MAWRDLEESFVSRCRLRKLHSNPHKRMGMPSRGRQRIDSNVLRVQTLDSESIKEAEDALDAMAKVRQNAEKDIASALVHASVEDEKRGSDSRRWTNLLRRIEQNHAWRVKRDLGLETVLTPVYPNIRVQEQFLDSCAKREHNLSITYHGTLARNISSIQEQGLLIPGHGGVKVANGSAHGVGIYTAQLGFASLSKGFCDSDTMFVCAVCDTSQSPDSDALPDFVPSMTHVQTVSPTRYTFQGRKFGQYQIKQESKEIRHVGDAVVVFQEECVVPVFTATVKVKPQDSSLGAYPQKEQELWVRGPVQIGRRKVVVPESNDGLIKFGSLSNGRSGKTVRLPAVMPRKDATAHERSVQHRLCRKDWQRRRHSGRRGKVESMMLALH